MAAASRFLLPDRKPAHDPARGSASLHRRDDGRAGKLARGQEHRGGRSPPPVRHVPHGDRPQRADSDRGRAGNEAPGEGPAHLRRDRRVGRRAPANPGAEARDEPGLQARRSPGRALPRRGGRFRHLPGRRQKRPRGPFPKSLRRGGHRRRPERRAHSEEDRRHRPPGRRYAPSRDPPVLRRPAAELPRFLSREPGRGLDSRAPRPRLHRPRDPRRRWCSD